MRAMFALLHGQQKIPSRTGTGSIPAVPPKFPDSSGRSVRVRIHTLAFSNGWRTRPRLLNSRRSGGGSGRIFSRLVVRGHTNPALSDRRLRQAYSFPSMLLRIRLRAVYSDVA